MRHVDAHLPHEVDYMLDEVPLVRRHGVLQQRVVGSRLAEGALGANECALELARSRFSACAADLQSVLIAELPAGESTRGGRG